MCKLASERIYISDRLGVKNDQHLIMFYFLYAFSDNIYYLEEENVIVVFNIKGNELNLYDILSIKQENIEKIISKIATYQVKRVNFHFTPWLESEKVDIEYLQREDCTLLIKASSIDIKDKFQFSRTSHA